MNGDKKSLILKGSLIALLTLAFYSKHVSSKKLFNLKKDPTLGQYLNRLIEFFNEESLDRAQEEFLNMVDFGMYPHEAFKILTFDGELN